MDSSPSFVFRFPYFPVCRDLRHISLTSSAVNSGSTAESSRRPPQELNPRLTELKVSSALTFRWNREKLLADAAGRLLSPHLPVFWRVSNSNRCFTATCWCGETELVLWPLWGFQSVSLLQPHISDSVTELAPWFHSLHDNPIFNISVLNYVFLNQCVIIWQFPLCSILQFSFKSCKTILVSGSALLSSGFLFPFSGHVLVASFGDFSDFLLLLQNDILTGSKSG